MEPAHSWTAGEPRQSQSGAPIGGIHRDSYWSAPLPNQSVGSTSMPLENFLSQQLVQLGRHREFLSGLQADEGEISLLIEVSPVTNAALTLSTATVRKLADLNLEVEFQFVGE